MPVETKVRRNSDTKKSDMVTRFNHIIPKLNVWRLCSNTSVWYFFHKEECVFQSIMNIVLGNVKLSVAILHTG